MLAGHYERKRHTKAGEVHLKVPKLRRATFESQVVVRYLRREISVEEALVSLSRENGLGTGNLLPDAGLA